MDLIYLSSGVVKASSETSSFSGLLSSTGLPDLGDFGGIAQGGASQEIALYRKYSL